MTAAEAQELGSGDLVARGYFIGIIMRATSSAVWIYWEYQKPLHETTTYSRGSPELRDVTLKRKAPQKAAGAQRNGATNGDSHRSNGMASPLVR